VWGGGGGGVQKGSFQQHQEAYQKGKKEDSKEKGKKGTPFREKKKDMNLVPKSVAPIPLGQAGKKGTSWCKKKKGQLDWRGRGPLVLVLDARKNGINHTHVSAPISGL